MSHFSTIKTKIKHKPQLIEALELLQYDVQENKELINPLDHQHEKVKVDISIGDDIGFRLNNNGEYELVADIQTWKDPVPPKRFVEKVTQLSQQIFSVELDLSMFEYQQPIHIHHYYSNGIQYHPL